MGTPVAPNSISMDQIRIEAGVAQAGANLNDNTIRALAGVPGSGVTISFDQLRNKSAYTAMTTTTTDVYVDDYSTGNQYSGHWYPSVFVNSGGNPPYTYAWTFTSNPGGFGLSIGNTAQADIYHTVTKYGWAGNATMNVRITDNTGHIVDRVVNVYVNIQDGTGINF